MEKSKVTAFLTESARGYYVYSIIAIDKNGTRHAVVGNSPPEMVIE